MLYKINCLYLAREPELILVYFDLVCLTCDLWPAIIGGGGVASNYGGDQFYWWTKLEYLEKTTDMPLFIDSFIT
jgi:hypothetical protein